MPLRGNQEEGEARKERVIILRPLIALFTGSEVKTASSTFSLSIENRYNNIKYIEDVQSISVDS